MEWLYDEEAYLNICLSPEMDGAGRFALGALGEVLALALGLEAPGLVLGFFKRTGSLFANPPTNQNISHAPMSALWRLKLSNS